MFIATACSGSRARPLPAPVVTAAAVPADAGAPPRDAPPPDPRVEAVLAAWGASGSGISDPPSVVAGPVDYPEEGVTGARVAAVVAAGGSASIVVTAVPFVAEQLATASLSTVFDGPSVITAVAVRDVNGDRRNDVAVFGSRESVVEGYLPLQRFAVFYTLQTAPERSLASMERATVQLLGVRDEAALASALSGMNTYEPPAEGMSPARFIARLRYATPAQFRQAVAATGLRLCTDFPDRTGTRRKRCATHPAARLTDAMITGRIRRDLGQFMDILDDGARELTFPSCAREGGETRCGANVGGPAGVNWSLVGEGAAMRLVEISPWAESS